jgi:hypothetical protein
MSARPRSPLAILTPPRRYVNTIVDYCGVPISPRNLRRGLKAFSRPSASRPYGLTLDIRHAANPVRSIRVGAISRGRRFPPDAHAVKFIGLEPPADVLFNISVDSSVERVHH